MEQLDTILSEAKHNDIALSTLPSWELLKLSQVYPCNHFNIKLSDKNFFYLNHHIFLNLKDENSPLYLSQTTKQQMKDDSYFDLSVHSELAVVTFFYFISIIKEPQYIQAVIVGTDIADLIFEVMTIAHLYHQSLFKILTKLNISHYTWEIQHPQAKTYDYMKDRPQIFVGNLCALFFQDKKTEEELVHFLTLMYRYDQPFELTRDILYFLPYTCKKINPHILEISRTLNPGRNLREREWIQLNELLWRSNDDGALQELQHRRGKRDLMDKEKLPFGYITLSSILESIGLKPDLLEGSEVHEALQNGMCNLRKFTDLPLIDDVRVFPMTWYYVIIEVIPVILYKRGKLGNLDLKYNY